MKQMIKFLEKMTNCHLNGKINAKMAVFFNWIQI